MNSSDEHIAYTSDTASVILSQMEDDSYSISPDDIVILTGGDWAHPKLGYGFLKEKCDDSSHEMSTRDWAGYEHAVSEHMASFCDAIVKGATLEDLSTLAQSVLCQIAFVSRATEKDVTNSLKTMASLGFGFNEHNVSCSVKRPNGGYGVVFHEVYSYWGKGDV
jgi:hypothetical protein